MSRNPPCPACSGGIVSVYHESGATCPRTPSEKPVDWMQEACDAGAKLAVLRGDVCEIAEDAAEFGSRDISEALFAALEKTKTIKGTPLVPPEQRMGQEKPSPFSDPLVDALVKAGIGVCESNERCGDPSGLEQRQIAERRRALDFSIDSLRRALEAIHDAAEQRRAEPTEHPSPPPHLPRSAEDR